MKQSDRGMVRYAPYQSLVEQAKFLSAMRRSKQRVEQKTLMEDDAEAINEVLSNYQGEEIVLDYFQSGVIRHVEGTISRIDTIEGVLWVDGKRIPLPSLQALNRK
ncbi:MAG: YolD-like family protein [Bacilli bacterium]|nr:YolD-like family protein [Bacilli bacterium]